MSVGPLDAGSEPEEGAVAALKDRRSSLEKLSHSSLKLRVKFIPAEAELARVSSATCFIDSSRRGDGGQDTATGVRAHPIKKSAIISSKTRHLALMITLYLQVNADALARDASRDLLLRAAGGGHRLDEGVVALLHLPPADRNAERER